MEKEKNTCPPVVTRHQLITWSIPVILFLFSVGFGAYSSLENRVRNVEINFESLKTELRIGREAHQKSLNKLIDDMSSITTTINSIDKKISVVEEKVKKQ